MNGGLIGTPLMERHQNQRGQYNIVTNQYLELVSPKYQHHNNNYF